MSGVVRRRPAVVFLAVAFPVMVGHAQGRSSESPVATCTVLGAGPEVTVLRAPTDVTLPQVAVDDTGTLHLIYFRGPTARGRATPRVLRRVAPLAAVR